MRPGRANMAGGVRGEIGIRALGELGKAQAEKGVVFDDFEGCFLVEFPNIVGAFR